MPTLHGEDVLEVNSELRGPNSRDALQNFDPDEQLNVEIHQNDKAHLHIVFLDRIKSIAKRIGHFFLTYTICHIPLLNLIIMLTQATFLARLSFLFEGLYSKNKLVTVIVSNLLLFGLADTLAQTLTRLVKERYSVDLEEPVRRQSLIQLDPSNLADEALMDFGDDVSIVDHDALSEVADEVSLTTRKRNSLPTFNLSRFAGFMVWGFMMAFIQVPWYNILNKFYEDEKNIVIATIERVLTDQLCFSPISLAAFFTYSSVVLEGGNKEAVKHKLRTAYLPTLVANYSVWPAVQFFNFLVMPKRFQVPFSSSVGVLWNAFLSIKNASSRMK